MIPPYPPSLCWALTLVRLFVALGRLRLSVTQSYQGITSVIQRSAYDDIQYLRFKGHHGPVRYIERNPSFSKYFLSIGDWSFRLWADDLFDSPIMWSYTGTDMLTHGCWLPARPSVVLTSGYNGRLEAWVNNVASFELFSTYVISNCRISFTSKMDHLCLKRYIQVRVTKYVHLYEPFIFCIYHDCDIYYRLDYLNIMF